MKQKLILILLAGALLFSGCNDKEKLEKQDAYRQIGMNCMAEGKYEDAVKAFQSALDQSLGKIGEREIDTCFHKAEAQYLNGELEEAIKTYTALIEYDEKNADAYFLRGCLYLKEGQWESAFEDFNTATVSNKKDYELYIQIAELLKADNRKEEAEKYLQKGLEISGKTAEDYVGRGRIYLLKSDCPNAKKELEQAIEKNSTEAALYLGQVYMLEGNSEKAGQFFEEYLANNEGNIKALESLATLEMEAEEYKKAITHIEAALSSEGEKNEQNLRRSLIQAYEKSGQFELAKQEMERYVEDYPHDEEAAREYEFLQTR